MMQFECSFDVLYNEDSNDEEMKMRIDSVSVLPKDCEKVDTVYSAETSQLEMVIMRYS